MPVILILILVSLTLAVAFLAGFIWAVRSGQYEDTCTPAMRILAEDATSRPQPSPPMEVREICGSRRDQQSLNRSHQNLRPS